ncbi:hypothetical protein H012_gp474 [Acanthamoeba polyphaga moumouvirus]|uniref:Uncharacterized protein n=1 Tax=Acanthamoeba polyphaga moumouvirus TaxID=1269028 RepID=L7RCL7_9VIRU|nr:hypothetical protein H012_gp474 [Acanthamoeba polyphaga moumouvirus]AGC01986.1 hypothetical protein Moumou_00450 [Acanthamoeba polyphaga moumouvirus]
MIIKIIIIGLIFLILFIIFIYILNKKTNTNEIEYNYKDIRKYLKTGDIILFSCKKHENFLDELQYFSRTTLLGSEYGHVGLIMRENDKIYVVECTDNNHTGDYYAWRQNNYKKGGLRIIDLDILLKEYYKSHMGAYGIRFISEPIPNHIFLDKIKKYYNMTFESKLTLFTLAFIDICISHDLSSELADFFADKNKLMCSEFTHDILHRCGILKSYPSKIFWPHLIDNKLFDSLHNSKYSELYKFNFKN